MPSLINFTLNKIINDSLSGFNTDQEKVNFLFHFGLQEFFSLISGLYVSGLSQTKNPPPGFISKFTKTYNSPTLGGILNEFILWIATYDVHPSLHKLSEYLLKTEKKGNGWMSHMVQWRNKYEHPKEYSKEEVLDKTIPLIHNIPNFSDLGEIAVMNDNGLCWISDSFSLPLEPLIYLDYQKIQSFTDMDITEGLRFKKDNPQLKYRFSEIWSDLRINDCLLENPTIKDIKYKILKINKNVPSGQNPWWASQIMDGEKFMGFVEPGCLNFFKLNDNWTEKKIIHLTCTLTDSISPIEMICSSIGIASLKNINELVTILGDHILVLKIETTKISYKKILSLLFWIADMQELGITQIRVIIERDLRELEIDQEKLWDRLPEGLDNILNKTPRAKDKVLKSYYWHRKTKKRLFGFF
jgi:hypothetical protein